MSFNTTYSMYSSKAEHYYVVSIFPHSIYLKNDKTEGVQWAGYSYMGVQWGIYLKTILYIL